MSADEIRMLLLPMLLALAIGILFAPLAPSAQGRSRHPGDGGSEPCLPVAGPAKRSTDNGRIREDGWSVGRCDGDQLEQASRLTSLRSRVDMGRGRVHRGRLGGQPARATRRSIQSQPRKHGQVEDRVRRARIASPHEALVYVACGELARDVGVTRVT